MAEITTPIVTITLVLAAVFVPVAFIPGMTGTALQPVRDDDRLLVRLLGVQLADVQPGDGPAVPPARSTARRGSSCSAGSTRGLKWVENSYDSFLDFDGPPLVDDRRAVARPAGADRLDDRRAAQGVHPDRGPGLPDRRRPDARRHQPASRPPGRPARRGRSPGARTGVRARARARRPERHHRDQPDQLRRRLRRSSRTGTSGRRRSCGPPAWPQQLQAQALRGDPRRRGRWSSSRRRSAA